MHGNPIPRKTGRWEFEEKEGRKGREGMDGMEGGTYCQPSGSHSLMVSLTWSSVAHFASCNQQKQQRGRERGHYMSRFRPSAPGGEEDA